VTAVAISIQNQPVIYGQIRPPRGPLSFGLGSGVFEQKVAWTLPVKHILGTL